jgi:hypothetical protein
MKRSSLLIAMFLCATPFIASKTVVNGSKDPETEVELQCDLPQDQHLHNLPNGGGCCVFASMDMAARWHHITPLIGVLNDKLGGGYPKKVDSVIAKRFPGYHNYIQANGEELGVPLLDWALSNGHIACVTYGYSERYGKPISHMVCLVHLDKTRACVLDNNFPDSYEWMDRTEFIRRWKMHGGAWCYVFLEPPPPPVPTN